MTSPYDSAETKAGVAKASVAWVGAGAGSTAFDWSQIAAMAAACYTALLIVEFLWKKLIRPLCVLRGWVKPLPRRRGDD